LRVNTFFTHKLRELSLLLVVFWGALTVFANTFWCDGAGFYAVAD
jgi:hypothetical protein